MSAGPRLARLLALVPWLVAHPGVTVAECAAHFGVTEAELERDLWLVVVCGVPGYGPDQLVDIDFWDEGEIHVIDPQTLARPMRLTQEEALTLLVALRMLAQLPGVEDRGAVLSAAAKLEELTELTGAAEQVVVDVGVPAEVTRAVDQALAEGRDLHLRYAAATRDEVSQRTVVPLRLLAVDGVAYLEADCRLAGARRTFRLDRILEIEVGDPSEAVDHASSDPGADGDRPAPRLATLVLEPSARWVVDVHRATVRSDDGDRITVEMPLHSLDWGARLVLSLAGAATALDPPELVDAVRAAAGAARESYPWQVT